MDDDDRGDRLARTRKVRVEPQLRGTAVEDVLDHDAAARPMREPTSTSERREPLDHLTLVAPLAREPVLAAMARAGDSHELTPAPALPDLGHNPSVASGFSRTGGFDTWLQ